jgi:hypothetical protein
MAMRSLDRFIENPETMENPHVESVSKLTEGQSPYP